MCQSCKNQVYNREILDEFGEPSLGTTVIYEDNMRDIQWLQEGVRKVKHVSIRQKYVLEKFIAGIIKIVHCNNENRTAYILNKALIRIKMSYFVR